jgi:hypothetical protein
VARRCWLQLLYISLWNVLFSPNSCVTCSLNLFCKSLASTAIALSFPTRLLSLLISTTEEGSRHAGGRERNSGRGSFFPIPLTKKRSCILQMTTLCINKTLAKYFQKPSTTICIPTGSEFKKNERQQNTPRNSPQKRKSSGNRMSISISS